MASLVKPKHLNLYKRYTEQLIKDLDKGATLYFDDQVAKCTNCIYDTVHKSSSNKYNGTGPRPFTGGICPVCSGAGVTKTSKSITIQCTVNWGNLNRNDKFESTTAGNVESNFFKIKTFISNYDYLKTAKYIEVDGQRAKLSNVIKRGLKDNVVCVAICEREK